MNQLGIERAWKIAHGYDHDWADYVWDERLEALRSIRGRDMNQTSQWWIRRNCPALAKALYDGEGEERRIPRTLEEAQLLNLMPYLLKPDNHRFTGSEICGHLTREGGVHCLSRLCGIVEIVVYRVVGFSRHVLKAEVQPISVEADIEVCGDYVEADVERLARPLRRIGVQQINGTGHAASSLQQLLDKAAH